MKKYNLTKEERYILRAAESGKFNSIKNKRNIERYSEVAKSTLAKNKTISIRISEVDLTKLKAKAVHEGVPYQTLITSSLHKLVRSR